MTMAQEIIIEIAKIMLKDRRVVANHILGAITTHSSDYELAKIYTKYNTCNIVTMPADDKQVLLASATEIYNALKDMGVVDGK